MEWFFSLLVLVALEAVLGIDNLLYIAIESSRVKSADRQRVQRVGIIGAVVMRIVLLLLLVQLIEYVSSAFRFLELGRCCFWRIQWTQPHCAGRRCFSHLHGCKGGVAHARRGFAPGWSPAGLKVT